jgi:hypothetical protein
VHKNWYSALLIFLVIALYGRFFFKKREILEFAINKEGNFDIKNREITIICENTPYFKKNL